jgi:transposase
MLTRPTRFSALKHWALAVAKRRGMRRAKVALARKLATVLHLLIAALLFVSSPALAQNL